MEAEANVKVVMAGHGKGQVFVDGVMVPHVRSIKIAAECGKENVAVIELVPPAIEIDGVFDVTKNDGG